MITMARDKREVWRGAYGAISRAETLEIVGYSIPPDDIEIRTLLRAGLQRGRPFNQVVVRTRHRRCPYAFVSISTRRSPPSIAAYHPRSRAKASAWTFSATSRDCNPEHPPSI